LEFSEQASKRLAVPQESWGTPLTDAEKHSRVLDCRGFSVVVRMDRNGPSTLSIVDTAAAKQEAAPAKTETAPAKTEPSPAKRKPRKKGKTG
jgi:hypothetical protein